MKIKVVEMFLFTLYKNGIFSPTVYGKYLNMWFC